MNEPKRQPKPPRRGRGGGRNGLRLSGGARAVVGGLAALPLLGLTVASGVYSVSVYHLLRAHLVPIAESELTRQFKHEVRIGQADFSRRGALVLTDIAVSNKATFQAGHGESVLTARRLTVDYSLHDLLFDSGNAAHAIGDITVDQPSLLIERLSKTQFNFSDLIQKKSPKPQKLFQGRLIVHGGLLRFRDYLAPAGVGTRPALNTLAGVEATVDFGAVRNVYFVAQGRGDGRRLATLHLDGAASREVAGRFRGHVAATDADAAYWTAYFADTRKTPQVRIVAGRLDADVVLSALNKSKPPGVPLDLAGSVAVRGVGLDLTDPRLRRLPLRALTGTASFTGAGVSLNARALLAGQPLTASGTVFDFVHPQVALALASPRLDALRLARAVPGVSLPPGLSAGMLAVSARVTGAVAAPTVTANVSAPALGYGGNRVTSLLLSAVYAGKILSVPAASFRINGAGRASVRATLDLSRAKPAVLLAGDVRDVDLAALRLPPSAATQGLNLGGLADAQFLVDNAGRPLSVVADVSGRGLRARQTTLQTASGRVSWTQGGPVTVTRLTARSPSGVLVVSGMAPVGAGRWNLTVRAVGLDLGGLLRPYSKLALGGRAAFDGTVTGPARSPQVSGGVRLAAPRYGRYSADLVTGHVTASRDGVRLQDVVARRFPTAIAIDGSVTQLATQNPALDLRVALSQGDVADFLRLAEQASAPSPKTAKRLAASLPNLTGVAQGAFRVSGRVKSPVVSGHALVMDATVGDYRVDRAAADLSFQNNTLHIANARIASGAATLTASGSLIPSGAVSAAFTASGLDLTRFHALLDPYADVTGTVSLSGSFAGTPQAPRVVLKALDVPDLVVNRQTFAPFTLAGRYADGVLTQTGGPLRLVVRVPSDYAAEKGRTVEYDLSALRLSLPAPGHPNRAGTISAQGAIPEVSPESLSHVFATVRATPWARTATGKAFLARLAALPQPISGTFALPRVVVSGTLAAPQVRADLSAQSLVLGETRVAGLRAALDVQGGARPGGSVQASATDLLAGGVPVGVLTADASYESRPVGGKLHRVVTVRQLRATSARAFLNLTTTADLDGDAVADLDASNVPLALLETAVPSAAPILRALPREISDLSLDASGPIRATKPGGPLHVPNLVGSISLSNPETPPAPPPPPTDSGKGKKGKKSKKSDKKAPDAPDGIAPDLAAPVYALDRIRSGTITLASASPDAPKVLTVTDLAAFKGGRVVATLSGTLPVFLPGTERALLPDQDLHASLLVQDLSALAAFAPGALDPKKTGGQLKVSASYGSGQVSGLVTLLDGSVGAVGFDTAVNKINGVVVVGGNRATVQSLAGRSSKGGGFALSGGVALDGDNRVDLHFSAKDLTVDENSRQSALFQKFGSGLKAKINGMLAAVGPLLTPRVSTPAGQPVVISDAVGTLPAAATAAAAPGKASAFNPSFDVAIQVGGGRKKTASVRSALLRADAGGRVRIGGRLSAPTVDASLAVASGQFTLPPATLLKIVKPANGDQNSVHATYPVEGPDGLPTLETRVDLTAQANVSPTQATLAQGRSLAQDASTGTGGIGEQAPQSRAGAAGGGGFGQTRQHYTITAHIVGVLNSPDDLKLDLTSSPPGLNRTQMLAALVPVGSLVAGGGGADALESQLKNAVASLAVPSLLSPLTDAVGGALGVVLDVSYQPDLSFVTVTKQIGPRLDVTFSRSFGARGSVDATLLPPQYTLKLGYDFTSRLRLGVATDDQKNDTVTLESVLKF